MFEGHMFITCYRMAVKYSSYFYLLQLISGSGTTTPLTTATPEPSKSPTPNPPTADQPHAIAKFKFESVSDKELSFQKVYCLSMSHYIIPATPSLG